MVFWYAVINPAQFDDWWLNRISFFLHSIHRSILHQSFIDIDNSNQWAMGNDHWSEKLKCINECGDVWCVYRNSSFDCMMWIWTCDCDIGSMAKQPAQFNGQILRWHLAIKSWHNQFDEKTETKFTINMWIVGENGAENRKTTRNEEPRETN